MFNLINLSGAKGLVPVVLLALFGVGIYWAYSKVQANNAATAAANASNNDPTAALTSGSAYSQLANLSLLQQLFGGSTSSATQLSTSQATYTAPTATNTGSNAQSQPAPSTSGSSTGNSSVTQGV